MSNTISNDVLKIGVESSQKHTILALKTDKTGKSSRGLSTIIKGSRRYRLHPVADHEFILPSYRVYPPFGWLGMLRPGDGRWSEGKTNGTLPQREQERGKDKYKDCGRLIS